MEQTQQSSGQQQGRQQPLYDTRNGGHYGNDPLSSNPFKILLFVWAVIVLINLFLGASAAVIAQH